MEIDKNRQNFHILFLEDDVGRKWIKIDEKRVLKCQHSVKKTQVGFLKKPSLAVYHFSRQQFPAFRQPDVHHSEEKYLELLDSFNGVTET